MAVKIRLKRLGKVRAPYYRVVVADSRKKRDGRVIEEIGKYHPTEHPSLIDIDGERARYWLGVGAQPSEQVLALLKVTGDWQTHKGLPGGEGTLLTKDADADTAAAVKAAEADAELRKAKAAEAKEAAAKEAEAKKSEEPAAEETPAEEASAEQSAAEEPAAEADGSTSEA
ncbi:30S ribosomal protein S16 [Ruania halotolerans]|uniref:30S ribosomal protein S16 n=1 Tax=Ruania halotolerans TaxID=2897773 RepID=UPI001E5ED8EB|nr:30S ribosomal protein S16 [Ruania halotolerans]UFU08403.1 30S ribosomal protein S16 [Ruania halotolerans]